MTDLEEFEDVMAHMGVWVERIGIGGFLPGCQIQTDKHAVTFIFKDDGSYDSLSVMEKS